MTSAAPAQFWHIDVRIKGAWKAKADYATSGQAARNRADTVYHWATVRVREVISGETWSREPGKGWVKDDPATPGPPPADPRSPMRAPQNAAVPLEDVWYRKGDME